MRRVLKRFYFIIIILVCAMATLVVVQNFQTRQMFEAEFEEANQGSLSAMAYEVDDWFFDQQVLVLTASNFLIQQHTDEGLVLDYFRLILEDNPELSSIYFGTPDNEMINGSGWIPPEDFDLRERPWYLLASDSNHLVITEPFENASGDDEIVTIARAVHDHNGQFLGVVGADISTHTIQDAIGKYQYGGIQSTLIVDRGKAVMMEIHKTEDNARNRANAIRITSYLEDINLTAVTGLESQSVGSLDESIVIQPIRGSDWYMATLITPANISLLQESVFQAFLIIFGYTVIIILGIMIIMNRNIIHPVIQIENGVSLINPEEDASYRIHLDRGTDFDALVAKINDLLSRIETYIFTIRQDRIKLNHVNTELKRTLSLSRQTEEELKKQKINLEALFKNSTDAILMFDERHHVVDINEGFTRLFGYELEEIIGLEVDSVVAADPSIDDAQEYTQSMFEGRPVHSESKRRIKDGTLVDVAINGISIIVDGDFRGGYATYRDISDRKRAEEALAMQKAVFEELFRNSTDAIVMFDERRRITQINQNFTQLFGYLLREIEGRDVDEIISDAATRESAKLLTERLLDGIKIVNEGVRSGRSGIPRDVMIKGVPIVSDGRVIGGYAIYSDISARKQAEREILYMSYHDQLTELYNRRFFEEEIKRLDTQRNLPLALIMADVNGLKLFNDAFGHKIGDRLLKTTADIFRRVCRQDEIIARLGGDEFVILLPKTTYEETEAIVERIREESAQAAIETIPVSISFGWDVKEGATESIDELYKRVEDYMYRNKLIESPSVHGRMFDTIIKTLHEKNPREERHSARVSQLSEALGRALGLKSRETEELRTAGWLHDIGKIAIKESILNKDDGLDQDEWVEVRRHPEIGYRILSTVNEMADLAEYVLAHHERWDGKGYPQGLEGDRIPIQGRIIALTDAYDAMTSPRTYRRVLTRDEAIEELRKHAGTQFDPSLVEVFIAAVLSKKD